MYFLINLRIDRRHPMCLVVFFLLFWPVRWGYGESARRIRDEMQSLVRSHHRSRHTWSRWRSNGGFPPRGSSETTWEEIVAIASYRECVTKRAWLI